MNANTNLVLQDVGSARPLSSNAVISLAVVAGFALLVVASSGPNLDLAVTSAITLVIGTALLWRPGEPPIMLLVFAFQWMQASVAILQATFTGQTVDGYYPTAGPVAEATNLTLATLVCLAVGMRLAAGSVDRELKLRAQQQSARGRMLNWFVVYVVFWCVGAAALYGAQLAPPLAQVFLGINSLRWAFFFMLAAVHFERGGRAGLWFPAAFAFEFALSIGGFFSSFKTVFFVTFIGAIFGGVKVSALRMIVAGLVAIAAFAMGVIWTAIKPDYRAFASGGQVVQGVTVDYPAQMMKIGELVSELDQQALGDATTKFLDRLSYVEFFGSVLAHVPQNVAHENGALLIDAFTRPFMPRVLFPEKTEIHDSERTRYYTGRFVSGVETGTSISIGWVAEVYIDFGRWGMLLAGVAIGAFYGLIYRSMTTWRRTKGILGFGLATAVLLPAALLESSITKVIGGVTVATLAAFLIVRFVVPLVSPWIQRAGGRGT